MTNDMTNRKKLTILIETASFRKFNYILLTYILNPTVNITFPPLPFTEA